MILRNIEDQNGLKVGGQIVNNMRNADDTVLIATSEQSLQRLLDIVSAHSESNGLSLNTKKTVCMTVSKQEVPPQCKNQTIKQVNSFKYLGFTLTSDAKCDSEIKKRIAVAKETFTKMRSLFNNRNITLKTKLRLLKTYVWSILMYGCECWTLKKDHIARLEATEMWFLRRLLRIPWTDKIRNEEVMERADTKRNLMSTIRERQLKFFGHIIRKRSLEHLILTGKIEGKRSRGRQRITYTESLKCATQRRSSTELFHLTGDREAWKSMVADVCNRPGT